jgi:hypothetical protein
MAPGMSALYLSIPPNSRAPGSSISRPPRRALSPSTPPELQALTSSPQSEATARRSAPEHSAQSGTDNEQHDAKRAMRPGDGRLTLEFSCGAANVIHAAGEGGCAAPSAATIR